MSKRAAVGEAPRASPLKKLHTEFDGAPSQYDDDDGDDDFTTAQTPSSTPDVDSPVTAATTPRAKFPSDLKTLACTWAGCPKTFNRPARLRDHLNSHTNSRPFKCPYDDCAKDYIEDKHLKQHIKAAHTNERKYACQAQGCGKSFVTGTRLKRHQAVHEGADRFRCHNCGQSFRKRETLTKHVRKEHLHIRAFACPEQDCPESFDSKPALKRHRDKIHGELKFWCGECALQQGPGGSQLRVGFTTELLLQAHLKKEHQNCLFCDYKSTSKWELEQHVDMRHSGKTVMDRKVHACTHPGCGKKFTKPSNLKAHIRTAHEGFRFVCGQFTLAGDDFETWTDDRGCGQKFSTKVRLEDHIRFIHLGHERPRLSRVDPPDDPTSVIDELTGVANQVKQTIFCTECNEGFTRYHDLEAHLAKGHAPEPTSEPTSEPEPDAQQLSEARLQPRSEPGNTTTTIVDQPVSFLDCLDSFADQPLFDQDFTHDPWPGPLDHDGLFPLEPQMDDGGPKYDWLPDETNFLFFPAETSHEMNRTDQMDQMDQMDLTLHVDPSLAKP
ncbi:hypothetical protein E4U43_003235 [Claviceps pusilla]|uniref:C2H2-type domain-containing protein n=1 Tax=Claviceps pusilla TaxID=123648 RepID=A0A9P7N7I1_9HYPO|nr:hypothetical protein E4U43_003235 [Claviceps pusilla]